ncbi:hypothetical protein Tco_0964878 [Tanacetum coccineum]
MDWKKRQEEKWQKPITHEITVLVKNLLIPLMEKTKSNTNEFERALKEEMFDDLQYVQSLEKEVDKLKYEKAEVSNEYDLLLQECVSKDIIELSKRNENVKNKSFYNLSKKFDELEKHFISLELSLQHKNEVFQNNRPCKNQDAPEFPEFFEINELKAQLQDKNIVMSDLKAQLKDKTIANAKMRKNWNKMKGKGVDTSFGKPSILGRPLLQTIRNQPVVRQPTAFKSERSQSSKTRNSSKRMSFQSPKESVCSNDMVHNYYLEEAKKKAQIQKDKALNTKPRQSFFPNKSFDVYMKTTPPRSGLTWKPTGRIFTYVGLRWIPTRKSVETYINTNDSALPLGNETYTSDIVICANSSSLSANTSMASEPISSKGSTNVNIIPSSTLV